MHGMKARALNNAANGTVFPKGEYRLNHVHLTRLIMALLLRCGSELLGPYYEYWP